jgi:hypothetical protein
LPEAERVGLLPLLFGSGSGRARLNCGGRLPNTGNRLFKAVLPAKVREL